MRGEIIDASVMETGTRREELFRNASNAEDYKKDDFQRESG